MLWVKAFHVIFMVTWFAGLFYLPRLFVYHAKTKDKTVNEQLKIMEHRLYYYITTPGGILTIFLGCWLLSFHYEAYSHMMWLHIKLILVATLVIFHLLCGKYLLDFKHDRNQRSEKFFRIFNEYPSIILVAVILLTFVKPSF